MLHLSLTIFHTIFFLMTFQNLLGALHKGVLKDKAWLDMFGTVSKGLAPTTGVVSKYN